MKSDVERRYESGESAYSKSATPTWLKFTDIQFDAKLIRKRGAGGYLPENGSFPIGNIAATYKIGVEEEMVEHRVLVVRHPAAAWLIIDMLGESRQSRTGFKSSYLSARERILEENPCVEPNVE